VRFQEIGDTRTRIEVQMNYWDPPGGKVGEVASRAISNPKLMMEQDLRNFKEIIEGTATPEEIQQRPAAATAQSGAVVAFLTSGTGLVVVGGGLVLWLLLRRRGGRSKKSRIIFEFQSRKGGSKLKSGAPLGKGHPATLCARWFCAWP
jgi:hypothetical protein